MTKNRIQTAQVTIGIGYHVGRRRAHKPNQDHVGSYADITPDDHDLARKGLLYLVADGMGGAAGGDLASQMAVHVTLTKYYQDKGLDILGSLGQAVQIANQKIHERGHSDPVCWGMGTTIVGAVVRHNELNVMNVGDSRAYLLSNEGIKLISVDHSLVQEQVRAGLLTQEEAAVHPRRNVLSRNLGYAPQTQPDFARYTMKRGDYLLLCSDGLWGLVSDPELAQFLQTYEPQDAADKLVDLANRRGGPDNISLIILRLDDFFADEDDQITDPTPLLEITQSDLSIYDIDDDENTDPSSLFEATEQILIQTNKHKFDVQSDTHGTHVFNDNKKTRKLLNTTGTMVVPPGHDISNIPAPSASFSDPTPSQTKRFFIWVLIVFLIALFVFFSMIIFDILPMTFTDLINMFSMNQ